MYTHDTYSQGQYKNNVNIQSSLIGNSANLKQWNIAPASPPVIQCEKWIYQGSGTWISETQTSTNTTDLDLPQDFNLFLIANRSSFDDSSRILTAHIPVKTKNGLTKKDKKGNPIFQEIRAYIAPDSPARVLSSSTLARNRFVAPKVSGKKRPPFKEWKKGYNAHHLIPSKVVAELAQPSSYPEYDQAWNCMMLPDFHEERVYKSGPEEKGSLLPLHGNHPDYNNYVLNLLKVAVEENSTKDLLTIAQDFASKLRKQINPKKSSDQNTSFANHESSDTPFTPKESPSDPESTFDPNEFFHDDVMVFPIEPPAVSESEQPILNNLPFSL